MTIVHRLLNIALLISLAIIMCHRTVCPNDGKPTWWGCGNHIEEALAGVPESERCQCEHERIPWMPLFKRVKATGAPKAAPSPSQADPKHEEF